LNFAFFSLFLLILWWILILKKIVTVFSKKTGDFASLSLTDLKVLALTWMLEKEAGNLDKLRMEPIRVS